MKLKKSIRLVGGIALVLAVAMALSSCGVIIINRPQTEMPATTVTPETEGSPDQTTPPTEETTGEIIETEAPDVQTEPPSFVTFPSRFEDAEQRLDLLGSSIDISGFDMIYAAANNTVDVIFSDEESPLYAARTNRNAMVEEKYSSAVRTIYQGSVTSDNLLEDIRVAVSSGATDYYLDLLVLSASDAGRFLSKGLLKDMRSLPFYDINEGAQSGNIGMSRYFDLGEGADAPECLYALYFNRALVGKDAERMLYEASLDGALTWEMILTVSSSIGQKTADIAVKNGENAVLGEFLPYLAGYSFVSKDASGMPKITLSEQNALALDSVIESVAKLGFYTPAEGEPTTRDKFVGGEIPFYVGTLSEMLDLYDEPLEWGLLTLPSDRLFGAYSDDRPVLCIPATNSRLEPTSIWLTALNAASGDWIRDQYHAISIKNHIRDNNSCLTLSKILLQSPESYFERAFSGYYEGLKDATYGAVGQALIGGEKFSAALANNLSAINKKLAKLP